MGCGPAADQLGELRDEGVDLKLIGFSEKELAEYLAEFDTDLKDELSGSEEPTDTVRCPKCGHKFACPERSRRAKR